MWNLTVKNILAHKLRLALTAVAIVLGVGFVSGTFVLGDTIKGSFNTLFSNVSSGKDAVITGKPAFTTSGFTAETDEPVPESVLAQVKAVPGVAVAEGSVSGIAYVVDKDGKAVSTGFAPTIGASFTQDRSMASTTVVAGRGPERDGEVAIDKKTADDTGFKVGDKITVVANAPAQYTLVGIVKFGNADSPGGASLTLFDLATAQRVLNKEGVFDEIDVRAAEGTDPDDLVATLQQTLGSGVKVRTGAAAGQDSADQINQGISAFTTVLSVFGFIALFVGSFIIINTFSILLAQRQRELALLRALGASRKQLRRSVLGEAFITGLLASIVGVAFGILVAIGLKALFSLGGASFPPSSLVIKPAALIIPMILGVIITCLAAYLPARRSAKVPPIAAMRDALPTSEEGLGRRIVIGSAVLVVGVATLAAGLFAGAGLTLIGIGALLAFVGVTMLVPLIARPLSRLIGAPVSAIGPAGSLGRDNAMRNPRRTSSTASALLVGLALVGAVTTIGASLQASFSHIIDTSIKADYVVETQNGTISPEVGVRIAQAPSVATVAAIQTGLMQIDGDVKSVSGVNPDGIGLISLTMKEGSVSSIGEGKMLIDEKAAEKNNFTVGQPLTVVFPRTGATTLVVGGTYETNQLAGNYIVSSDVLDGKLANDVDVVVLAKAQPGQLDQARADITAVTKDFPNVDVRSQAEFKAEQKNQIDQALKMVLYLLALSVLIAVIGIVNTLALSVVERTREIGLLRAVGMQRRQVKRMIRSEAVIVALLGSVIGLVVGILLAAALVSALSDSGIDRFAVPVGRMVVYLVVAGLFGIVAAIWPARRANKLDVLKAITTE